MGESMTYTKEIICTVCYVEWIYEETMGPDDDREPGTYVTIKAHAIANAGAC